MKKCSTVVLIVSLLICYTIPTNLSFIKSASANMTSDMSPGAGSINEDTVVFVDKPSDDTDFRPLIEGAVSFEENVSMQASVFFPADGTPQSIALEDGNGFTWELKMPADALDHPETITMTSMKNISSSLGEISGGIILQPDGLRFNIPITLSVRGAGIEQAGLLFSGNDTGEELEISIVQRSQEAVELRLFHFSTAYASDDKAVLAELAESAQDSIRKLSALAKQILNRPIEVPVPPAIPIKCHHDTEDQDSGKIAKYVKDFGKPEVDLINALLAARTIVEASTGTSPDFTLELRLVNRLIKKGNMLIRQYKGQEDMFLAVAVAVLSAERQSALLGEPLAEGQSFLPVLAEWAQSIAQKYLDGLVKNHEYKNIHPILKIARSAAVLGSPQAASFMDKLREALTFQLETTNTVKIGNAPSTTTYVVESKAEVMALNVSKTGMVGANGKSTYKSFEMPPMEGTDMKVALDQLGASFDILVGMEGFLPCMYDTFTIYVDRFGAESETITVTMPDVPSTSRAKPVVQMASEKGFADRNKDGMYSFKLSVQDGQKVAADQTFTPSSQGLEIEYKVKLIHAN